MKKLALALALTLTLGACCKAQDQPRTPEAAQAPEVEPEPEPTPEPMPPDEALLGHWVHAGVYEGGQVKPGETRNAPSMTFDGAFFHGLKDGKMMAAAYEVRDAKGRRLDLWQGGTGIRMEFPTDDLLVIVGGIKKDTYKEAKTMQAYKRSSATPLLIDLSALGDATPKQIKEIFGKPDNIADASDIGMVEYQYEEEGRPYGALVLFKPPTKVARIVLHPRGDSWALDKSVLARVGFTPSSPDWTSKDGDTIRWTAKGPLEIQAARKSSSGVGSIGVTWRK